MLRTLCFLLCLGGACLLHAQDPVLRTAESLRNNVVRLSVSFPDGSKQEGFGFITGEKNGQLYLATAAHVVHGEEFNQKPSLIQVWFYADYKTYTAEAIRFFELQDLALLQMFKPSALDYKSSNWADFAPQNYQAVRFVGRQGEWLIPGQGEVYKIGNDRIVASMTTVRPGTSGAPLINSNGIIGMIIEDDNQEVTAIALSKIRELFADGGRFPYFNAEGDENAIKIPNPPVVDPNAAGLDLQNWRNTKSKDTRQAYQDYINQAPKGTFVSLARDSIQAIDGRAEAKRLRDIAEKQEQTDWGYAIELNNLESYQEYLRKNPQGKNAAEARRRRAALLPSPDIVVNGMVKIEGGKYRMGCIETRDGSCGSDETPDHEVSISGFYLGKYEVTNVEFVQFLNAISAQISFDANADGVNYQGKKIFELFCGDKKGECSGFKEQIEYSAANRPGGRFTVVLGFEKHPAVMVSKYGAEAYCAWLSSKTGKTYRLPTEAEWEFAARGGIQSQRYKYAGSNDLGDVGWYNSNSSAAAHPIGLKKGNELGLYDMSGNVREWCSDWYEKEYYKNSPASNPKGPSSGTRSVLRGGSWYGYDFYCRLAIRDYVYYPDVSGNSVGFRIARNL